MKKEEKEIRLKEMLVLHASTYQKILIIEQSMFNKDKRKLVYFDYIHRLIDDDRCFLYKKVISWRVRDEESFRVTIEGYW